MLELVHEKEKSSRKSLTTKTKYVMPDNSEQQS